MEMTTTNSPSGISCFDMLALQMEELHRMLLRWIAGSVLTIHKIKPEQWTRRT